MHSINRKPNGSRESKKETKKERRARDLSETDSVRVKAACAVGEEDVWLGGYILHWDRG